MPDFSEQFKQERFVNRFNQGDESAFMKVYDFYLPKIFRFLYYQARQNKELTEDLTQKVFIKAWEYITVKNGTIENIQAFLYRIARNLMIDHWRVQHKETLELMDDRIETTEESPRWIEKIDAKITVEALETHMSTIPENYREVITMRFIEELEISEIANILGKDKNNIYVLVHRALKALRAELATT